MPDPLPPPGPECPPPPDDRPSPPGTAGPPADDPSRAARGRVLDYGGPRPEVLVSRVAIASLLIAVLGSPCVLIPVLTVVGLLLSGLPAVVDAFPEPRTLKRVMVIAGVLPALALLRVWASRGTRRGARLAWAGLAVAAAGLIASIGVSRHCGI